MTPFKKVPVVSTTASAEIFRPSDRMTPARPAAVKNKPFRRGLQNIKILLFFQRFQHIFAVKLTVGLRPGTAGRPDLLTY